MATSVPWRVVTAGQVDLEHLVTFDNDLEAQLARTHLEGAGIVGRVVHRGRAFANSSSYELFVPASDVPAARDVLASLKGAPSISDGVRRRSRAMNYFFLVVAVALLLHWLYTTFSR